MNSKSVFTSLTFWSSVTMLLSGLAPKVFVVLGMSPETTASGVVAVLSFVLAVYGRWKATRPLHLIAPK
jgi:hypothetical protein